MNTHAAKIGWVLLLAMSGCGGSDDAISTMPDTGTATSPPLNVVAETPTDDELGLDEPSPRDTTSTWLKEGVVDSGALTHWLRARQYRDWTSSSKISPSAEGGTRVFLNATLAQSLEDGVETYPIGSIGVRELYENDLFTPRALNLLIKMDDRGDEDGSDWLWIELTALEPGGELSVDEPAAPRCVACHSAAPTDFIQSTWPLR